MKRFFAVALAAVCGAVLMAAPVSVAAAEKESGKKAPAKKEDAAKAAEDRVADAERSKLVTEGELAQWLVRVLGLSRFLPAAPTDLECFQILMQNGIAPKDGWSQERTVTTENLARVLVLALGKQAEVENPQDDKSWVGYLKSVGIDFGTIGEAVENLEPLPQPVGPEAIVTSTDPLGKLSRINPPDNQQIGADLSTLGRVVTRADLPKIEVIIQTPTRRPDRPRVTPS